MVLVSKLGFSRPSLDLHVYIHGLDVRAFDSVSKAWILMHIVEAMIWIRINELEAP